MAADELELLPVVTRQQPPPPTKGAPSPVSWPSERRSRRGGDSSPVEVRLVVHEAQKLFAADSGGTSDPFVRASAFGQTQDTKVVKEDLNPFFDELLQFKTTLGEIRSGALTLEVFDYDMLQSDDLLGGYVFDLGAVLDRPHKELYKAWVTLLDTSGGRSGPQGRVRVTLTILEDGDEMPPRPGQEVKASESDLRQYSMRVRCLRAEGLPTSKADQFITLRWAGTTVMARGKARPTPNGIDCTFEDDGLLELPVIREENPKAPPVRLRPSPSPLLCLRLTAWLITALSGGAAAVRVIVLYRPATRFTFSCERAIGPQARPEPSPRPRSRSVTLQTCSGHLRPGGLSGSTYLGPREKTTLTWRLRRPQACFLRMLTVSTCTPTSVYK